MGNKEGRVKGWGTSGGVWVWSEEREGGMMGGKKVDEVRREDRDIVFSVYC